MNRRKVAAPALILVTTADADNALREIAEARRDVDIASAALNEQVDRLKEAHREAVAAPLARIEEREKALALYANLHKATLFAKKRGLDLTFGRLAFRLTPPRLATLRGVTWEEVVRRLKEYGLTNCLKVTIKPDRDAMKAELTPAALKEMGCELRQAEEFAYETFEITTPEAVAGGEV